MGSRRDTFDAAVREEIVERTTLNDEKIDTLVNSILLLFDQVVPSCLAKADVAEPVFVLRGQDVTAADTVDFWIDKNSHLFGDKFNAAMRVRAAMWDWPNKKKSD